MNYGHYPPLPTGDNFLSLLYLPGPFPLSYSSQRGLTHFPGWRSASALSGEIVSKDYVRSVSCHKLSEAVCGINVRHPLRRYCGPAYFTAGATLFVGNVSQTYACLRMYIPFRTRGSHYEVDVS
jgi:hypothetical protein